MVCSGVPALQTHEERVAVLFEHLTDPDEEGRLMGCLEVAQKSLKRPIQWNLSCCVYRRDGDDGGVGQTVSLCEGGLAIFGRHASSGGTDRTGGDWTRGIGRL